MPATQLCFAAEGKAGGELRMLRLIGASDASVLPDEVGRLAPLFGSCARAPVCREGFTSGSTAACSASGVCACAASESIVTQCPMSTGDDVFCAPEECHAAGPVTRLTKRVWEQGCFVGSLWQQPRLPCSAKCFCWDWDLICRCRHALVSWKRWGQMPAFTQHKSDENKNSYDFLNIPPHLSSFFSNCHQLIKNWVVVSNVFYFHPYLGKIPILTNIFQLGWIHQPEKSSRTFSPYTIVWYFLSAFRRSIGKVWVLQVCYNCGWGRTKPPMWYSWHPSINSPVWMVKAWLDDTWCICTIYHHIGAGCWLSTVHCFVAFWFQALQLGSYKADLKHDFDRGWFSQGVHCHWIWTSKILKAQPADMIRFCVFVNSSSSSIFICFGFLSQISPLNDICVQIQAQAPRYLHLEELEKRPGRPASASLAAEEPQDDPIEDSPGTGSWRVWM